MDVRIYLVGCHIRCKLRIANIPARWPGIHLDSLISPVLHLSFLLLSELPAVLRTGGKCDRKWNIPWERDIGKSHLWGGVNNTDTPSYYAEISEEIKEWTNNDGYIRPGLTLKELSETLHTNRTYLSEYIRTTYNMSFRDWITGLRMEYAKREMMRHPEWTIDEISKVSGFLSSSHFMKNFKEKEGYSPAKWRKSKAANAPIRQDWKAPEWQKYARSTKSK